MEGGGRKMAQIMARIVELVWQLLMAAPGVIAIFAALVLLSVVLTDISGLWKRKKHW